MAADDAFPGPAQTPLGGWRVALLALMGLLGAGVLAALVLTVDGAARQRDRALDAQSHSYQVMILARALAGSIAKAEASLGRYVTSEDQQLGRIFADQWESAGDGLDRLARFASDDPEQSARVAALADAFKARGEELGTIALSTRYKMNRQALIRYYQARQSPSLTRIDQLLDAISDREQAVLAQRSDAARQSIHRANVLEAVLIGFGILIVLAALALGAMTLQAWREQAEARAEADAERQRALTERERATELETAIAEATAELRHEADERGEAEAKLRQIQKMEAIGQLTGGIAHDFNNMLAVVVGGLELARRQIGAVDPLAARHIDGAMEGAQRAAALTRQLLAFARAEPLLPEAVEPAALIAGMRDLLDRTLGDGISIAIVEDAPGWQVWADRHGLENAILNLAVNARDAMDGRGRLVIATGQVGLAEAAVGHCAEGDYVTIAVSDHGRGMPPEVLERAFEPFFTTKPPGKGTGLGLSQILGSVQQMGGEVAIDSAPGRGTTVTLYLPRHQAGAAAPRPKLVRERRPRPYRRKPAKLAVLVVEDDPRVLAATMAALKELGHRPIACNDPLAAPDLMARAGQVDLILTDVLMPQQTGPEMVAGLLPLHPEAAVLFVTGYAADGGEAAQFGDHPVLRKPFTLAALEAAIGEAMALDRAPPAHPAVAAE